MSSTNWIELVIAIVALVLVTLSAWVEASLAAVSRVDIRRLFDNRLSREDALAIERTQRLRSSILTIELLCAGTAATLLTFLFSDLDGDRGLLYGLLVSLAVLIVAGRLLPRAMAADHEDWSVERTTAWRVGRILAAIFAPIVRPVDWLAGLLAPWQARRRLEVDTDEPAANGDANGHASDREADERRELEEDEEDMITAILHLEEVTARQIMVPRIDIVAVSREILISEAVDVAIQAGHSRIPVFGRSMDEILGVIYAKDMLKYVNEAHEGLTIETLMRPAYFVPESKRVDDLLNELQQQKTHLAVVVDEYGGTAGVVTIEDILEEIVGEIQDEFDREAPQFELISEDEAIADGRISIDDLEDEMDLEWPEDVSGTLGGYIQRRLGRIPTQGEVVELDGLRLTVLKVEHRRIRQVRVERRLSNPELPGGDLERDSAVASQFP